jgi:hypothetical protein
MMKIHDGLKSSLNLARVKARGRGQGPRMGRQHDDDFFYFSRRQFITNRTARTQDNKNVGRKSVTHWHRREREKKRERERNWKGRKRRDDRARVKAAYL